MSDKIYIELSKIEQSALLDLFEIDLTAITNSDLRFRFHNGMNELRKPVIWQGHTYEPYPIRAQGFSKNGQGTSNRPTLDFANIGGVITDLANEYEDLLGAIVIRRQVMLKFLDAENFKSGNTNADPNQEVISNYVIERLTSINSETASFELALPCESDGALIPARVVIANTCCWEYRSVECGYSGGAKADALDNPTTDINKDKCSRTLDGCKLRWGENGILPFGGFPSCAKINR